MRRVVYYSVAFRRDDPRPDLAWELEASVSTLRRYNPHVPVGVFVHGDPPARLSPMLAAHRVALWRRESYEQQLAALLPRGWQALALYPLLHKFLNLPHLAALAPDQILFLDCDTLFAGDVDVIFSRYTNASCWAREEPTCSRSHYGYDRAYLDEALLAQTAQAEGVRIPPPFNLGVVLWNGGVWSRATGLSTLIVHYAWRLLVWLAMNPASGHSMVYGESEAARFLAAHADRMLTDDEMRAALPYPSANRWILDQVALWFALGHIAGLTYGDFSRQHVLQNGEFEAAGTGSASWILCHYYTQNRHRIEEWGRARGIPAGRA